MVTEIVKADIRWLGSLLPSVDIDGNFKELAKQLMILKKHSQEIETLCEDMGLMEEEAS